MNNPLRALFGVILSCVLTAIIAEADDFKTQSEQEFYNSICGNWIPANVIIDDRFLARKLPKSKFSWGEATQIWGGYSIDRRKSTAEEFYISEIYQAQGGLIRNVRKINSTKYEMQISINEGREILIELQLSEDGTILRGFGKYIPYAPDPWTRLNGPNYITPRIDAYNKQQQLSRNSNQMKVIASAEAMRQVGNCPSAIIQSILNKDMNKLASYVHSRAGLRIIPGYKISGKEYAYSKEETAKLLQQAMPIQSELFIKPIKASEYLSSMIFNGRTNPEKANRVVFNEFEHFEIENVMQFFPGSILVEYIYGSESLGLLFIQDEQKAWKLSAILSDMNWV